MFTQTRVLQEGTSHKVAQTRVLQEDTSHKVAQTRVLQEGTSHKVAQTRVLQEGTSHKVALSVQHTVIQEALPIGGRATEDQTMSWKLH
ncbi:hypothetical protein RRG08_029748 [Elysia crispata]|uniref:Uncharacterized protein n=1 Tax=Elysia crispata TaxID=231223 RepID=A0AAE1EA60_9GAST|nr:hypothetical protein RRG08_029748 [Elysia crispata]